MAVRFTTDVPVTMVFPFGDFLEVQGMSGPQQMYSVEVGGERDKLFAPPDLHKKLQAVEVGLGSELMIRRTQEEGRRKGWRVEAAGHNGHTAPAAAAATAETEAKIFAGVGEPIRPEFAAYQLLMKDALVASFAAWNQVDETGTFYKADDVRAVGISLFLECARKGVIPKLEGLPF